MAELQLAVQKRTETKKSAVKRLRRNGFVPGVVYCQGKDSVPVYVGNGALMKVARIAGYTRLIDLDLAGEKRVVLIKELSRDPIKGNVIHVDFQEVRMDKQVQTLAPIVLVGESERENDGGIISMELRELGIECLPSAIPDRIEVDVSKLKIGDTICVNDLTLPEGVNCLADPEEVVVSVTLPDVDDTGDTEEVEAESPEE